jgi:hypothetical protein
MTLSWLCEGSGKREGRESRAPKPNISTFPQNRRDDRDLCGVRCSSWNGPVSESDRDAARSHVIQGLNIDGAHTIAQA